MRSSSSVELGRDESPRVRDASVKSDEDYCANRVVIGSDAVMGCSSRSFFLTTLLLVVGLLSIALFAELSCATRKSSYFEIIIAEQFRGAVISERLVGCLSEVIIRKRTFCENIREYVNTIQNIWRRSEQIDPIYFSCPNLLYTENFERMHLKDQFDLRS